MNMSTEYMAVRATTKYELKWEVIRAQEEDWDILGERDKLILEDGSVVYTQPMYREKP